MSETTRRLSLVGAVAPVTRRVRAYFAPVNRAAGVPTVFDAAQMGAFALDSPPAPWVDLGWCAGFVRKSATKVGALRRALRRWRRARCGRGGGYGFAGV